MLHPGLGTSVQALQALDQKLDIADAALLELHVDGGGLTTASLLARREPLIQALACDRKLLDGREIQGRGVSPRFGEFEQCSAGRKMAGSDACLDQHLQ